MIHAASPWLALRLVVRVGPDRAAHLFAANLERPLERFAIKRPFAHLLLNSVRRARQLGLGLGQGKVRATRPMFHKLWPIWA